MLNRLELYFYQPHQASSFDFSNGVNAITGQSDSGKTSTIRGLEWLVFNRPTGFAFKSDFSTSKDTTKVVGEFAEGKLERSRSLGWNGYILPDGDKVEALKGKVPDEVSSLANLAEHNIQGQHDGYFLLQDSPGEVGRKLNDVVGLDVIDDVQKKVNSIATKAKAKADDRQTVIEWAEGRLESEFASYGRIETLYGIVDKNVTERMAFRVKYKALGTLNREIRDLADEIEQDTLWLELEKQADDIFVQVSEVEALMRHRNSIETLAEEINGCISDISGLAEVTSYEYKVEGACEEIRQLKKDKERFSQLTLWIDSYIGLVQDLEFVEEKLELAKVKFIGVIGGECPFCEEEISEASIEKIRGKL